MAYKYYELLENQRTNKKEKKMKNKNVDMLEFCT